MRDYTALCAIFMVFYGVVRLYAIPSRKVALIYLFVLVAQYAVVRSAASNYGSRMVATVLPRSASMEGTRLQSVAGERNRVNPTEPQTKGGPPSQCQ